MGEERKQHEVGSKQILLISWLIFRPWHVLPRRRLTSYRLLGLTSQKRELPIITATITPNPNSQETDCVFIAKNNMSTQFKEIILTYSENGTKGTDTL
jgi:hypothetical protein